MADDEWTYRQIIRLFDLISAAFLTEPPPVTQKAEQ